MVELLFRHISPWDGVLLWSRWRRTLPAIKGVRHKLAVQKRVVFLVRDREKPRGEAEGEEENQAWNFDFLAI